MWIEYFPPKIPWLIRTIQHKRLRLIEFCKRSFTCSAINVNEPFNRLNVPALIPEEVAMMLTLKQFHVKDDPPKIMVDGSKDRRPPAERIHADQNTEDFDILFRPLRRPTIATQRLRDPKIPPPEGCVRRILSPKYYDIM